MCSNSTMVVSEFEQDALRRKHALKRNWFAELFGGQVRKKLFQGASAKGELAGGVIPIQLKALHSGGYPDLADR